MIDLVIPLGTGSKWENNELRYALRSVEKHLVGIRHVFIVGYAPAWLRNVELIPLADDPARPSSVNIYRKILEACKDKRVSQEFLFSNDDIFLTQTVEAQNYPFYYNSTLENAQRKAFGNWYRENLLGSYKHLHPNYPTLNYDVHTPIRYDKKYFPLVTVGADCGFFPTVIKSIYCNKMNVSGIEIQETKMKHEWPDSEVEKKITRFHCFSTGDGAIQGRYLQRRLREMFPTPSKYEA